MNFLWANILSIIYAAISTLFAEFCLNILRLQRLFPTFNYAIIYIVMLIILAILWYPLTKLTANQIAGNAKYWSVILWIPYTLLFIWIISLRFPITDPQYMPGPGIAFVVFPKLVLMFAYSFSINWFASRRNATSKIRN